MKLKDQIAKLEADEKASIGYTLSQPPVPHSTKVQGVPKVSFGKPSI